MFKDRITLNIAETVKKVLNNEINEVASNKFVNVATSKKAIRDSEKILKDNPDMLKAHAGEFKRTIIIHKKHLKNAGVNVDEGRIDDLRDNQRVKNDTDWYHDKAKKTEKKKDELKAKLHVGKYGKSNFKSMSEDFKGLNETANETESQTMNEGWGAMQQNKIREQQNKAWEDLLDKHKDNKKNLDKLKDLRIKNWSASAAEKTLKENIESSFSDKLEIFYEQGLKGLFESLYVSHDYIDKKLNEEVLSKDELEKREKIVKGMKKNIASFKAKYGDRAKEVIYATATKLAKQE